MKNHGYTISESILALALRQAGELSEG
jgi:hypothetical protein